MRIAIILAWALGCTGSAKDGVIGGSDLSEPVDPLSWAVDEPGPFGVGYQSITETYAPGAGVETRTIRLDVWYPTEDESGITATYAVGTDVNAMENAVVAPPFTRRAFRSTCTLTDTEGSAPPLPSSPDTWLPTAG